MTLEQFEHQGRRWESLVQPVASPDVESGIEIVFVAEDDREKYAWPLGTRLLQAVVEGGVSIDHHRLRKMLRRAMDAGRRPSQSGGDGESDEGVLSKVRKLLE